MEDSSTRLGGTTTLRSRTTGATNPVSGSNSNVLASQGDVTAITLDTVYHFTLTLIRISITEFQIITTRNSDGDDISISTTTNVIITTKFNTFFLLNP